MKLDTRLKTINELKLELETDIDSFDFEKKRKVLKILLWRKLGVGVYIMPGYSAEIRGLVDFSKIDDIERIDKFTATENTPCTSCADLQVELEVDNCPLFIT